jgi:ribosome recycling factor
MDKVIKNYNIQLDAAKKNKDISADDLAKLKATVKALNDTPVDKIDYYGIKQKATKGGISDGIDIVKFEL